MEKSSRLFRTALWFQDHGGLGSFLTLDTRQQMAARDLGLPVVLP